MSAHMSVDTILSGCHGSPYSNVQQRVLGSLWAGYGQLVSVQATNVYNKQCSLVIKHFIPPRRRHDGSEDHCRKVRSYSVESWFYRGISSRMRERGVLVPELKGVLEEDGVMIVMSDLCEHGTYYTKRGNQLNLEEGKALLSWLAKFHAVHWRTRDPPQGLWDEGSFWQLGTRREELDDMEEVWVRRGLNRKTAEDIHEAIVKSRFRTVIHGDAKAANFFFYPAGQHDGSLLIGGYDFQYSGMATPLRDVAYVMCCSIKGDLVEACEDELLSHYYTELTRALRPDDADEYSMEELEVMYELCVVDLARFMSGSRWWGNTEYIENKASRWLAQPTLAACCNSSVS